MHDLCIFCCSLRFRPSPRSGLSVLACIRGCFVSFMEFPAVRDMNHMFAHSARRNCTWDRDIHGLSIPVSGFGKAHLQMLCTCASTLLMVHWPCALSTGAVYGHPLKLPLIWEFHPIWLVPSGLGSIWTKQTSTSHAEAGIRSQFE